MARDKDTCDAGVSAKKIADPATSSWLLAKTRARALCNLEFDFLLSLPATALPAFEVQRFGSFALATENQSTEHQQPATTF